jgi:rfaE bifunctional protein nucleotidyltransferase chain/domain
MKKQTTCEMTHVEIVNNKIQDWPMMAKTVVSWRKDNHKIVFTNGCFDILHLGHADYLARAADLGTKLVVGLNTDLSVSRLKGLNRPITDQNSRGFLLACMSFVDAVVLFEEDTPAKLIELVCPDVLVKGGDYVPAEIVGHDFVTSRGGNVVTLPLIKGYSTTDIENRILLSANK